MAAGYDGTIRIDTRIEPKGFNDGVKKLFSSLGGAMKAISGRIKNTMTGIAIGMVVAAAKITAVLVAARLLQIAFTRIWNSVNDFVKTLRESLITSSSFKNEVIRISNAFSTFKGSVMALGATLLNALAPVLLKIIDWLTKAVNWVSMFISAMTGQKTVMQYVSGSTDAAAKSTDKLAKKTKEAEKAAKGALAAFDEINVLQMEAADKTTETPETPATGGNIVMREVAIPENFLKFSLENIMAWLDEEWKKLWEGFFIWLGDLWDKFDNEFKDKTQPLADWLHTDDVRAWWEEFDTGFREMSEPWGEWLRDQWAGFDNWFRETTATWPDWIKNHITNPIRNSIDGKQLRDKWTGFDAWFRGVTQSWADWIRTKVTDPIRNAFNTMLESIRVRWSATFNGLISVVKSVVNGISSVLNSLMRIIVGGINSLIRSLNSFSIKIPSFLGGGTIGFNVKTLPIPSVPRLATGAVIPPNAEFAAILGDQRSGRNIETPEGLLRQIFREELGTLDANVEINFAGSLGALVRELKPYIDKENVRIGNSLATRSSA